MSGTRHHHLAHGGVLQLEHAVDHLALGPLHHPLAGPHVHQGAELVLGDLGLVRPASLGAHQAQGERGEGTEENAHRPSTRDSHVTGRFHPGSEARRVLDRQGHGKHLAEHRRAGRPWR